MENKENNYEERNATLDDNQPITADSDELRDELLEESGMNGFQKYIARLDDAKWNKLQMLIGGLLGLIASVALFWDSAASKASEEKSSSIFTLPLIIAIVVALIVPNIIEKQGLRRAPKLRVSMVIVLVLAIVVFVAYTALTKGFN